MNRRLRRTGLSVIAMMLMSCAAVAQDVVIDDGEVFYAIDPIFVVDPIPEFADDSAASDETGDGVMTEEETSGDEDDTGSDDTWTPDEGDGIIVIDDGLCFSAGCVSDDVGYTTDGDDTTDGDLPIYYLEGPRSEDCPECRDITVEMYQMGGAGPLVTDSDTTPEVTSRRSHRASFTSNNAADCLALYPQLPWLCEWQNASGQ